MRAPLRALPPDLISLADYARLSGDFIPPAVSAWLEGGSGTEQALRANGSAFGRFAIYNRVLADLRVGSTAGQLLGQPIDHPVLLAPVGYHKLVHPGGEIETARGALDTVMVLSTMATCPVEEIAPAAAGPLWFQLYFQPHRDDTLRLLRRVEKAGCSAIVVTLDAPVQPASHAAVKAGFALSADVDAVHLRESRPVPPMRIAPGESAILRGMMAHAPTPDDLRWLRQETRLPLLAKGISHPADAISLLDLGFDGVVVSNHGGRALESAPAALDALPAIRIALGPGATILLDGGVRTGSDIFKAIALGANAVMIGRPQLHALAIAGSLGVAHMLKLLREELELVMALAGTATLGDIRPECLMTLPGGDHSC